MRTYIVPLILGISPETTTSPRLPPEICDRVIDHLHAEKLALNACALVCRGWLPAARLHRFRTVQLSRFRRRRDPIMKLLSDPHSTILPYVHELHLEEGRGETWIDHTTVLQIPYRSMPALESITITDLGWYNRNIPPYRCTLSDKTVECLKDLCRRAKQLSLVSPRTDSILPLLMLISGTEVLDRFSMTTVEEYDHIDLTKLTPRCPNLRTLGHLELDGDSHFMMDALCTMCPELSVHSFVMSELRKESFGEYGRFLRNVAATLQHFDLSDNEAWETEFEGGSGRSSIRKPC